MSGTAKCRDLFPAYASGQITDDDLSVLETALRQDEALRHQFIEYMHIDSALGDLASLTDAEIAELDNVTIGLQSDVRPDGRVCRRRRVFALASAAAALLVIIVSVWIAMSRNDRVAELVTRIDAVLVSHDLGMWDRTDLRSGSYALEKGLVHLRFGNDVRVFIEAPAQFEAVSDRKIILKQGRLSASVPPAGSGFTVETSEAKVVDYGTEFSVEAESGTSEVHVFEGLVRVHHKRGPDPQADPIDLRTAEAIRIDKSSQAPVAVKLAPERFVRGFDEYRRTYSRSVKELAPIVYYRMPIRDKGLVAEPPQYSGVVLTGDGVRPAHASGVFAGGSLRVLADSTGRGGRVDAAPPLTTGRFTVSGFVYLEKRASVGTVVTDFSDDDGNFGLTIDDTGRLHATIRSSSGDLLSLTSSLMLPQKTWHHIVVTADGQHLSLYEDGQLVASRPCELVATRNAKALWFGTDAKGANLWNGRIDEIALFDRAISSDDVAVLYRAALAEMGRSE